MVSPSRTSRDFSNMSDLESLRIKNDTLVTETNSKPLLFIDINIGADQFDRIAVFEGDKIKEVVGRFIRKHSLDEGTY